MQDVQMGLDLFFIFYFFNALSHFHIIKTERHFTLEHKLCNGLQFLGQSCSKLGEISKTAVKHTYGWKDLLCHSSRMSNPVSYPRSWCSQQVVVASAQRERITRKAEGDHITQLVLIGRSEPVQAHWKMH